MNPSFKQNVWRWFYFTCDACECSTHDLAGLQHMAQKFSTQLRAERAANKHMLTCRNSIAFQVISFQIWHTETKTTHMGSGVRR